MKQINVTTLKVVIASLGYKEIKNLSSTAFGVVVPKTHVEKVIPDLMKAFAAYKPVMVSTREMRIGDKTIFAKNREQQRGIKALTLGRGNEWSFVGALREWITDYGKPMTIKFKELAGPVTFTARRITKVEHTGAKNIFVRNKADVHLVNDKGQPVPLSLKDESAGYWESADSYWGPKSAVFVNWALRNAESQLEENGVGGFSLRPPIAIPANTEETRDVVFGADIHGRGAVVMRKWRPDDFTWNFKNDTLEITCKHIFTQIDHVKGSHEVFFEVRNEKNRNPKHLYRGLRAMAAMKDNLRGDKLFNKSDRAKIGI